MGAEFEKWWADKGCMLDYNQHDPDKDRKLAEYAWDAANALDTSPWLDKAVHSKGEARARLEGKVKPKLHEWEGICDACGEIEDRDDLYIILTPQMSGVALCMKCRLESGPYCEVPPEGWWCSRLPKHEGPCAARPKSARDVAREHGHDLSKVKPQTQVVDALTGKRLRCMTCGEPECDCQLDLFQDDGHK